MFVGIFFLSVSVCVCAARCMLTCQRSPLSIIEQFSGICFLLLPCVLQVSNSSCQAWQQTSLPTDLSFQHTINSFHLNYSKNWNLGLFWLCACCCVRRGLSFSLRLSSNWVCRPGWTPSCFSFIHLSSAEITGMHHHCQHNYFLLIVFNIHFLVHLPLWLRLHVDSPKSLPLISASFLCYPIKVTTASSQIRLCHFAVLPLWLRALALVVPVRGQRSQVGQEM